MTQIIAYWDQIHAQQITTTTEKEITFYAHSIVVDAGSKGIVGILLTDLIKIEVI